MLKTPLLFSINAIYPDNTYELGYFLITPDVLEVIQHLIQKDTAIKWNIEVEAAVYGMLHEYLENYSLLNKNPDMYELGSWNLENAININLTTNQFLQYEFKGLLTLWHDEFKNLGVQEVMDINFQKIENLSYELNAQILEQAVAENIWSLPSSQE